MKSEHDKISRWQNFCNRRVSETCRGQLGYNSVTRAREEKFITHLNTASIGIPKGSFLGALALVGVFTVVSRDPEALGHHTAGIGMAGVTFHLTGVAVQIAHLVVVIAIRTSLEFL